MRVLHNFTAVFDDLNLVSCAGLAPVLSLAERAGLQHLVADHVHISKAGGVNPRRSARSADGGHPDRLHLRRHDSCWNLPASRERRNGLDNRRGPRYPR
jgi:hypothetical protein